MTPEEKGRLSQLRSTKRRVRAPGKPLANEASIEQPPLSYDANNETDKGTLH
jgi:hypothetical protein